MSKRALVAQYTLLLMLALSAPEWSHAQAQSACRTSLRERESRTVSRASSDSVLRVWNELDLATWSWIRAWLQTHQEPPVTFPPADIRGLAESTRDRLRADAAGQRIAAIALSEMMRGEHGGVVLGQDVLASQIYRVWKLPPKPALALLVDPRTSYRARRLAVLSLEDHWNEVPFYRAAIGALCTLAAQADGMRGLTDSTAVETLLDEDQADFLLTVTSAFERAFENAPLGAMRPQDDLPPGNPVTEYLRRELCRVLGCGTQ